MTNPNKKPQSIHIDTKADNSEDIAKHLCGSASDTEKCEEFAERLREASNNIDPTAD